MYNNIKNVIISKQYELEDMIKKIDVLWLQGDLSDEQKLELVNLARDNAIPDHSYAALQEQVNKLYEITSEHAVKIAKLETGQEPEPQPEPEEYPEYKQPTGAHDAYHKDDKVTYNGNRYICIAPEGVAVAWNPDTYPAYWKKV